MLRSLWVGLAFVIATPALADGSLKDPPGPVVDPPVFWTGCYFGTDGGFKWGRNQVTTPGTYNLNNPAGFGGRAGAAIAARELVTTRGGGSTTTDDTTTAHTDGGLWGGQAGCNYDTRKGFIIGIEVSGTWDFAKQTYTEEVVTAAARLHVTNVTTEIERQCQFRVGPRLGATLPGLGVDGIAPLIYATGGYAATCYKVKQTSDQTGFRGAVLNPDVSDSKFESGWFAGVGIDIPTPFLIPSTFVQIEYTHADYGSASFGLAGSDTKRTIENSSNEIRIGFKYRFQ